MDVIGEGQNEVPLGKVHSIQDRLHFVLSSESMGNHDSGYDEWRCVC